MGTGSLTGRVALVTGAGRGIGRSVARSLAMRGAGVMAVARTEHDLASLAAEVAGIEYMTASVATAASCAEITAETRRLIGPIDILVNNAGIDTGEERAIWDQDPEVWRETLAVNLDAPFHLTRDASRDMIERGWGRIVMVSSTAGQVGGPEMSAYCSSKHGLIGLTRSVALDVGRHGVTCNAVAPGWVHTPMSERTAAIEAERRGISTDQVWGERNASYPQGRVVTPDEVAEVITFLVDEGSSAVNGEVITVALGGLW
jgi:NAD(P)-dependent dehydrogenase (short-subunit alcohol dehydrogenase family)